MKPVPHFWFEPTPWVDGQWRRGEGEITVPNPATNQKLATVMRAEEELIRQAIEGADKVFAEWKRRSPVDRGNILKRTATLMIARREDLAALLSAEQGKPFAQALGEVDYAASFFQWFGEEARRSYGRVAAHPEAEREFFVEHKPIGVAGLITPWNFPLAQGAKKIAAALAAGCTAVWKPAERTPLIALAMAPIFTEAGIPKGVLQIVPARGAIVGKIFAEHPAVRVLSLTGSTATGSALMADAARSIKRVSLELGGNAPFIVLPDADLEFTAEHVLRLKLFVSGQVCVTANRVFVHESIEHEFLEILSHKLKNTVIGNGLAENVDAGPLIHRQACQDVDALVSQALSAGAKLVCRNSTFERDPSLKDGSFYAPTLLANVQDAMRIASHEIFGPVIPVLSYSTVAEVIRRANETPYGLAGYVYGQDMTRCRAVARELEVGIIGVNEWRPLKAEIPFGGIKQSGIGAEGGEEGLHEFLCTQVISMPKPNWER